MRTKSRRNSLRFYWALVAVPLAIVCTSLVATTIGRAQAETEASGAAETRGAPAAALQARVMAVPRSADEQKPVIPTAQEKPKVFRAEEAAFLVELKNVGDKPISLQGTRYGKNVSPPWPGKSASGEFAPHLFTCEFFGPGGKAIQPPLHEMQGGDNMMTVSSGSVETIEPGKSLVMLIRPLSWDASLARRFEPGDFKIRVHYHGPGAKALEAVLKTWPDSQLKGAWIGDVATGEAAFTIAGVPENKAPEPVWGQPVDGLRAAVEFASSAQSFQAIRDTASATFPHGSKLVVHSLIQNASDHDIKFWSETWRQDDKVVLIDDSGKDTDLRKAWYSGWARMEHWTLKPGEIAVLAAMNLQIAADGKAGKDAGLPTIVGPPGK